MRVINYINICRSRSENGDGSIICIPVCFLEFGLRQVNNLVCENDISIPGVIFGIQGD